MHIIEDCKKIMKILTPNLKLLIKSLSLINILFLMVILNSCKENSILPENNKYDSATVTISPKQAIGYINQKIKFNAQVNHTDSSQQIRLLWTLSDSSIASISSDGMCNLLLEGGTYIYMSVLSARNEVLAKDSSFLHVDSLHFNLRPRELHLTSIDSYKIIYDYIPFDVNWSTGNSSVVNVDSTGLVSVNGLGASHIYATVVDSENTVLAHDSVKIYVEWWRLLNRQYDITSMLFSPISKLLMISVKNGEGIFASSDFGESWQLRSGGLTTTNNIYGMQSCLNSPGNIMAIVKNEGVIKTNNEGMNWQYINNLNNNYIAVAIHPDDYQTAFSLKFYGDYFLYKTTDSGMNWELIYSMISHGGAMPEIFIDPVDPQFMYLAAHQSIKSTDGGYTWSELAYPNMGPEFLVVHVDSKRRIYTQDYNWDGTLRLRLLRSSDFGNSWEILKEYQNNLYSYGTDYETSNIIYLSSKSQILISYNDGQTWEEIEQPHIYPDETNVGAVLINSNPLEMLHIVGKSVWKYKRAMP